MSGSVNVLTPAGRRQLVKVTPNTSILQILEDVCKKQGFSANDYDLTHHNKTLTLSDTIRFANLPNNAQLELVKSVGCKSASSLVTIGLQFPDGERCFSDFDSGDTLWSILEYWTKQGKEGILEVSDDLGNVLKPVCIYMRREIGSEDELKNTTLRILGLVSGKAILRLIHRLPNKPVEQAYVEDLILRRPKKEDDEKETGEWNEPSEGIAWTDSKPSTETETNVSAADPSFFSSSLNEVTKDGSIESDRNKFRQSDGTIAYEKQAEEDGQEGYLSNECNLDMEVDEKVEAIGQLNYLDDSGSILYNLDEVTNPIDVELPDEFYDVTVNDVQHLMADLKRQRQDLEDVPLKTSAMREAEQLTRLNRYSKTVIRVIFPDRLVLQGSFKSTDEVLKIIEFVRNFLIDRDEDFYLYTAPPKQILHARQRLFEVPLVPAAIVHFGCDTPLEHFLRDDVMKNISSPNAARQTSAKCLQTAQRPGCKVSRTSELSEETVSSKSSNEPSTSSRPTSLKSTGAIPKWFVLGKK